MLKFHCHFKPFKFILSITSALGEFILSCAMCQLFNEIETNYLNIFNVIFGIFELNMCTLG